MRQRIVVAVALTLVALGLGVAPAGAALNPSSLPRGTDSAVPYLSGRTLHVGNASYTLPDQSQAGAYRVGYSLVGLDGRGRWLVSAAMDLVAQPEEYYYTYGARARLFVLGSSGATMIYDERNDYGQLPEFRLNRTRSRVVLAYHQTDDDSFADTDVRVIDLDGHVVAQVRRLNQMLSVLDASGRRIMLGGGVPARVWTPGGTTRWITRKETSFADLHTGTLAVRATQHRWAMSTLAHPKRLRWKAWFQPVRVSPNGKRVVGVATTRNGRLTSTVQVRRLANGRVTNSYAFSSGGVDARTLAWQGSTAVVFQAGLVGSSASVLVRCVTGGRCVRASDPAPRTNDVYSLGDPLTFAFEPDSRIF
ncbi:hypothetical protein [Marmoricola sp. URHB0036]|uniref:hypothetical protein n=1 Tax=Marmoricola sp. URHB0036 TaxID=1298863 RepID=UPI00041A47B5|nr:hypothetical protein [Marmoricola sp. URHB0036]